MSARSVLLNPGPVTLTERVRQASQHGEGYSPFTQSAEAAFALDEALSDIRESDLDRLFGPLRQALA